MNRRAFLSGIMATAGGILVPYEPRRVYGFAPSGGWPQGDGFWIVNAAVQGPEKEDVRWFMNGLFRYSVPGYASVIQTTVRFVGPAGELGNTIAGAL